MLPLHLLPVNRWKSVGIDVAPPEKGEVLIKSLTHTRCLAIPTHFTLSGDDPEGVFPVVLGHEGAGL